MIRYRFIKKEDVKNIDDKDALIPFINQIYGIDVENIRSQLSKILDCIIDDLILFVEYPYVEKYYRDTYYNFYSKKHHDYDRFSFRISFFKKGINEEYFYSISKYKTIQENYFGYITLRPTTYSIIGPSFLSPQIFLEQNFVSTTCEKNVLIYGCKLKINGFPYCTQDQEYLTCAEISLLNITEYYAHISSEFSIMLPSLIKEILNNISTERLSPSRGLTADEISYVLKKLRFSTVIYYHKSYSLKDLSSDYDYVFDREEFRACLYTYIESGIPIIYQKNNHYYIVIGRNKTFIENNHRKGFFNGKKNTKISEEEIDNFKKMNIDIVVMDDNQPPYQINNYDSLLCLNDNDEDLFIAPIFPKVHMDAYRLNKLMRFIKDILQNGSSKEFKFSINSEAIQRKFLISCKNFKQHISKQKGLSIKTKKIILFQEMPKYIWVIEYIAIISSKAEVELLIAVDATESGDNFSILFAVNQQNMYCINTDLNEYEVLPFDAKERFLPYSILDV